MADEPSATIRALAERAGLDRALQLFPGDIAAAAAFAEAAAKGVTSPTDPRAEPWPPMRVGHPA